MKKNVVIYVAITILLCALASTTAYILMKDKAKENDNKPTENNPTIKEDGVKFLKAYELNDKIIEEIEITLNGKTKIIKIEYSYDYFEDILTHTIAGEYNNLILYNKDIRDEYDYEQNIITRKYQKEEVYNSNTIKNTFDKDNYIIIKGTDNKNYLIIMACYDGTEDLLGEKIYDAYIFNEELELISKDIEHDYYNQLDSGEKESYNFFNTRTTEYNIVEKAENISWYDGKYCNETENTACHQTFKVENNKIYYLALKLKKDYNENDYGIVEEREYTINNDKLDYKVIKTYKIVDIHGQLP